MAGSELERPLTGDEFIPIARSAPWAVNNNEDDANTAPVLIKAAPGAGSALYLTSLVLSKSTLLADQAITLEDVSGNVYFGPIFLMDIGGSIYKKDFPRPLKFADNLAIYVNESVGGKGSALLVYIEGFTGQSPIG